MKILVLLYFIASCSQFKSAGDPRKSVNSLSYIDASGKWLMNREYKTVKNKIVSRSVIGPAPAPLNKPLEKSITVSQIGTIKGKKGRRTTVRPFASDYSVWLDGKEYRTWLKLSPSDKSMIVELNSPEKRWQGQSKIAFPRGDQFCFFSQLPECLHFNQLLYQAREVPQRPLPFQLVWDGYPYTQELYTGAGANLFSAAMISFKEEKKGVLHFELEVDGQTLLFQFSKSHDLVRMFWIAQGVSILPPGEEVQDVE